ncbi:tryptophan synthase subunit alpha [Paradesulfitobacterium ferrireducens]|uniref:tryptophan synthase subunit alpha n=1 Tax=Paradesulfitobacterium ferrireducens TaxID=2816476 RepID=UPI001A8E35A7|nr:tryptophan synthase subunit alpha [Paradesulfitobacterium ferrireducens]
MSERLNRAFSEPAAGLTRLIMYLMAGDPDPDTSVRRLSGLAESGVDVIELGIPFSDPMADGPVIQAAAERALAQGMTFTKTLDIVRAFRKSYSTPLLLMGYLNPMLQYGWEKFIQDAVTAGVDGLIIPDLPWRESKGLRSLGTGLAQAAGGHLSFIPMIAQTGEPEDIKALASENQGFAYVLSRNGITGGEVEIPATVLNFIKDLRQLKLPLCVGFGIRNSEQVQRLAPFVDGVVVGSALVERFAALDAKQLNPGALIEREQEIFAWVRSLKATP